MTGLPVGYTDQIKNNKILVNRINVKENKHARSVENNQTAMDMYA